MTSLRCAVSCAAACALAAVAAQGAALVDEIATAIPRQKALVVQVGVGAADFAIACGARSNVVHGVEPDAAAAARAAAEVLKAGMSGRVWIEAAPVAPLPHVDNLANVLVVDDWKRVSGLGLTAAEFMRVLAPGGVGCVGQRGEQAGVTEAQLRQWLGKSEVSDVRAVTDGGPWLLFRKARPAGMDEWTHELHDGTRNPASQDSVADTPQQIHWIGGTPYTWQIEHYRTAGNRLFVFYAGRRGLSRWGTFKEDVERVEALDAFSGIQLWKRDYAAPSKGFFPIAAGDRIICQVGDELRALDAVNGDTAMAYTNAGVPYAGVVYEQTLISLRDSFARAIDLRSGALLWERRPECGAVWAAGKQLTGWDTYNPIAAEGMVLLLEKYRQTNGAAVKAGERVVGLDVKSGKEAWRFDDPVIAGHQKRHFYYGGRLFFSTKAGIVAVPLAKDKSVWTLPVTPLDPKTFAGTANFFGVNGMLWVRQGPGKGGFLVGENADKAKPIAPKTWVAADVETGKVVKQVGYEPGTPGWRGRCYPDLAARNFVYSENGEFADLNTGKISNFRIFRGHCGWGPLFGNGFFYGTPTWCIFCYPALHGAIAAGPRRPPATPVAEADRLEKGPATAAADASSAARADADAAAAEWPTYRQNAQRTAGTPAPVAGPLAATPVWSRSLAQGERVSAPIVAGGRVYAAVVNQGRLCALDEKTGDLLWSVSAGPRIDTPPTWHRGLLLFGSHDGSVRALRASDGALAWRFSAAPERKRMVCGDRVESAWPLPGATLVRDGTLYCLAGRITGADGGMHMYALDAATGAMKWHQVVGRTTNPKLATGGDPKLYYWIEPEGQLSNNHLVGCGSVIRLPDQHFVWDFRAEDGAQIVPDAVQGVQISTFTSRCPWLGYDRPTWSYTFHGYDIHPEYRHPYESGTIMAYAGTNAVGIVCKRLRKETVTELIPGRVDDAAKNWEPKTRGQLAWNPVRIQTDVHGLIVAGDTAYIGGMDFALRPEKGRVVAISMKTGEEVQRIELPALPTYDGLAAAHGRLFVSLQNGTLVCLGKAP